MWMLNIILFVLLTMVKKSFVLAVGKTHLHVLMPIYFARKGNYPSKDLFENHSYHSLWICREFFCICNHFFVKKHSFCSNQFYILLSIKSNVKSNFSVLYNTNFALHTEISISFSSVLYIDVLNDFLLCIRKCKSISKA